MADNPEQGTGEEGTVEEASQAILDAEDTEEEGYESQRPETSDSQADKEQEGVDAEDEDEDESEPQLYTVKVDGKEVEITLDELQSGYLKHSDYSKKTEELAGQRKSMLQQAQAVQQERNQYAQALGQMQSEAGKQLNEYKQIDWNQLREEDPMLFMQRRDEQRELEKSIEDSQRQQHHIAAQSQQYQTHKFNADVETGRDHLLAIMPDWDDKVSKSVRDFGLNEGFSSNELSGITDHRSMAVLRKAMMYDAIQKAQPAKKRVRAATPQYVKPGLSKSKGDVSAKKRSDKTKQLRKSGAVDDAASMIYDML